MSVTVDFETMVAQSAARHRRLCPRQVLGVRMGVLASELFAIDLPQVGKRLLALVETDGCFAEGVGVATGCSMGHRTLRLVDCGKVAATLIDTETGRAIRMTPAPNARIRADHYAPDAVSRWKAQLEAYQIMPDEELLRWQDVSITLDIAAIVGKPGTRVACAVCGEEILNQREVFNNGQLLCRSCAGDSYWKPNSPWSMFHK